MITFKEHHIVGYKARTIETAKADVTIAIAKDFTTAGEKCTKTCVPKSSLYLPVRWDMLHVVDLSCVGHIKKLMYTESLNIAGNGIYTLRLPQVEVDERIFIFLKKVFAFTYKPAIIWSGGQTGVDEAGLKAAVKLGIPAVCIAPRGWLFRDISGRDIANEKLFKQRFKDYI